MKKDDQYYSRLLAFARQRSGSCRAVAEAIGAKSGAAVEAWARNGVAYKFRPELDKKFGPDYRRGLREVNHEMVQT